MDILNIVTWSLFGFLLFGLFFGVLWGAIRGVKRSLFRLSTVLVAALLAFFLAPVIANPLTNINIINGMTIDMWILDQMGGTSTAVQDFPQLLAFVSALPIAILSLIIFMVLLFVFRFLTWIVYAIFASKIAPRRKKVKTGQRTANNTEKLVEKDLKPSHLGGAAIGLFQGLLLFFFLMIPVNGLITMARDIERYHPEFTAVSQADFREVLLDEDVSPLADVIDNIYNFNDNFQRSPYGIVTRFTGMQLFSGPAFSYLTTVRLPSGMTNVNLRRDAILGLQVYKDFVAINQHFSDDAEIGEVLGSEYFDDYWAGIEVMIDRIFDISLFRLAAQSTSNLASFIEAADPIDEHDLPLSLNVILEDLRNTTIDSLKSDLHLMVEIARTIFVRDENGRNLWDELGGLLNSDNPIEAIGELSDEAISELDTILGILTNDRSRSINYTFGFRMSVREFIAVLFEEALGEDSDIIGPNTSTHVNRIITDLRDADINFDWQADLLAIRATIKILAYLDGDDVSINDLINMVFDKDGEFFNAVRDSNILGPLVIEMVNDLLDELVEDSLGSVVTGITLNPYIGEDGRPYYGHVFDALALVSGGMNDIILTIEESSTGEMSGSEILDSFAQTTDDLAGTFQTLLDLPGTPIQIELDTSTRDEFAIALESEIEDATLRQNILTYLFPPRS